MINYILPPFLYLPYLRLLLSLSFSLSLSLCTSLSSSSSSSADPSRNSGSGVPFSLSLSLFLSLSLSLPSSLLDLRSIPDTLECRSQIPPLCSAAAVSNLSSRLSISPATRCSTSSNLRNPVPYRLSMASRRSRLSIRRSRSIPILRGGDVGKWTDGGVVWRVKRPVCLQGSRLGPGVPVPTIARLRGGDTGGCGAGRYGELVVLLRGLFLSSSSDPVDCYSCIYRYRSVPYAPSSSSSSSSSSSLSSSSNKPSSTSRVSSSSSSSASSTLVLAICAVTSSTVGCAPVPVLRLDVFGGMVTVSTPPSTQLVFLAWQRAQA